MSPAQRGRDTGATQDNELPSLAMTENFNFIQSVATKAIADVNLARSSRRPRSTITMSGNVNILTRSGTNQFRGSAFWLNNVEDFNARLQFLTNQPGLVYNQSGRSTW